MATGDHNSVRTAPITLSEQQMDPLESALLHQDLPGLAAAFDEPRMQAALQHALFDHQSPSAMIERCEVEQATYIARDCVIVRYTLGLKQQHSNLTREALVSGRLFPNQPACDAYLNERLIPLASGISGRDEVAWFDTPIGVILDLHMVVHAWPIDGDLPELLGATDTHRLIPILQDVLSALYGRRFSIVSCQTELVDYGRQQRATLRYAVRSDTGDGHAPQELHVYGKLTGDGSGAQAAAVSAALQQRIAEAEPAGRFTVPRVLAWRDELQLSLLEAISGEASLGDVLKASVRGKSVDAHSLDAMIDACARIAATLHTSGIALGPRRMFADECARLASSIDMVQRLNPDLGDVLQSYLNRLMTAAHQGASMNLVFCHGDFTEGQILFHEAGCGLIDFDSVCQAEPALDLGQFLTYLELTGVKAQKGASTPSPLLTQVREHFFASYADAAKLNESAQSHLRERVRLYQAVSLLRRGLRSWQKFKPNRIEGALTMLEHVLTGL